MSETKTVTITRTFAAPIQTVWNAWAKSGNIVQWWGPPTMDVKINEHEFHAGGFWGFSMAMPDGNEFVTEGVYTTIEEPNRIVTSADFKPMSEGLILDIDFQEDGDNTIMNFNVIHPTAEYAVQQVEMGFEKGWGMVFDNLTNFLAK